LKIQLTKRVGSILLQTDFLSWYWVFSQMKSSEQKKNLTLLVKCKSSFLLAFSMIYILKQDSWLLQLSRVRNMWSSKKRLKLLFSQIIWIVSAHWSLSRWRSRCFYLIIFKSKCHFFVSFDCNNGLKSY